MTTIPKYNYAAMAATGGGDCWGKHWRRLDTRKGQNEADDEVSEIEKAVYANPPKEKQSLDGIRERNRNYAYAKFIAAKTGYQFEVVLELLTGPMTKREISERFGVPVEEIRALAERLSR